MGRATGCRCRGRKTRFFFSLACFDFWIRKSAGRQLSGYILPAASHVTIISIRVVESIPYANRQSNDAAKCEMLCRRHSSSAAVVVRIINNYYHRAWSTLFGAPTPHLYNIYTFTYTCYYHVQRLERVIGPHYDI